jgi:hypothetical protein
LVGIAFGITLEELSPAVVCTIGLIEAQEFSVDSKLGFG